METTSITPDIARSDVSNEARQRLAATAKECMRRERYALTHRSLF